jgi:hypothetical protein
LLRRTLGVVQALIAFSSNSLEGRAQGVATPFGSGFGVRRACDSSLVELVDDVPRPVRGAVGLGAHRGVAAALLVGEFRTGCDLQGVIGPPSALPAKA